MPQLMPLSWVMSSSMILIMVMMMGLIYSSAMNENSLQMDINTGSKMNSWCW